MYSTCDLAFIQPQELSPAQQGNKKSTCGSISKLFFPCVSYLYVLLTRCTWMVDILLTHRARYILKALSEATYNEMFDCSGGPSAIEPIIRIVHTFLFRGNSP